MKILGMTYLSGRRLPYIKPDSALLVNEKPFFLPAFSDDIVFRPCLVVRVNRLGRNIESRFAHRYYDAWTIGLNMMRCDSLCSDLETIGFDNSLVVGIFKGVEEEDVACALQCNGENLCSLLRKDVLLDVDLAIEELTRFVTIRMGDMIAVDFAGEVIRAIPEDKWQVKLGEEQILTCKIK